MDTDDCDTPQKTQRLKQSQLCSLFNKKKKSPLTSTASCSGKDASYGGINKNKCLQPRTPKSVSKSFAVNTPPAKRFSRVKNPFEAALTERLHLPIIGSSPSLFQRPATPQHSSTQFEWTIEEVSSLQPANVEPHETQFQDSPDSEYEAKAQSAISLYFKEQQIVPSPVDCPLRNQRIILSEINGKTPITKPSVRRISDNSSQTVLSLPPNLPKTLEDALQPYFQYHENQQQSQSHLSPSQKSVGSMISANAPVVDHDARDVSLRRKLFDFHNIIVVDDDTRSAALQHITTSATVNQSICSSVVQSPIAEQDVKLPDSLDKDSFGSLSPISLSDDFSPACNLLLSSPQSLKRKSRIQNFELSEVEQLSPIHPPRPPSPPSHQCKTSKNRLKNNTSVSKDNYRSIANLSEQTIGESSINLVLANKFTPDRSSSPLRCVESAEMSVDSSFNIKVGRLAVNSSKCEVLASTSSKARNDVDLFTYDTDDLDEDIMQISQMSTQSNSSSADTPRSKRRSASRKNLSQSFSSTCFDINSDENSLINTNLENYDLKAKLVDASEHLKKPNEENSERSTFYRTDSGFNEMTGSTQDDVRIKICPTRANPSDEDVNMICCSTPSKYRS